MGKSADLVVGLVLLDKFSKTFDKFNQDVGKGKKSSEAFSGALGKVSQALTIGAVAAFGTSAVKAYGDALQSQQLLMDAFAKQPALVGYNVEALMAWNKELSTKIAYDDDEINKAQANLALFKLTGDQIKNLTPLVADLARRKGIDLATAATSVGKAMQGQARGLKDLGIDFKSTGDTAKDYLALQGLLQQQVGGTAEAFAKGNPLGQMQNMQIAFGNMQESIGQALVPAMTAFTNVMTPIANLVGSIPGPVMQIGVAIGMATLAARIAGPMMMTLVGSFRSGAVAATELTAAELTGAGAIGAQAGAAIAGSAAMRILSGAMTTAATAGRGLMAALGGPFGIAMIAATAAITMFTMKSDEASASTDDWASSLRRVNGELDEASKKAVAQKLAQEGIVTAVGESGIAFHDYAAAMSGTAEEQAAMIAQLKLIAQAHSGMGANGQVFYDATAKAALKAADALREYGPTVLVAGELTGDAAIAFDALTNASDSSVDSLNNSTNAAKLNATAMRTMGAALSDYSQTALQAAIDQLEVQKQSLETAHALGTINDAEYNTLGENIARQMAALQNALDTSVSMFGDLSAAADDAAGSINDVTAASDNMTRSQQRAFNALKESRAALGSLVQARKAMVLDVAGKGMDFASILGPSPEDAKTAADAWAAAQSDVVKAQAALAAIGPNDIEARTKAQQELNAAIAKEGEARAAKDAAAFTPENVVASYTAKFNKLKAFADDIVKLTNAGVPGIILQDILDAGIDGGSAMARMLATHPGMMRKLKKTAAGLENQSVRLGTAVGNYLYGDAIAGANTTYRANFAAAKAAGAIGANAEPIHITLKLDSKTVYEQLLRMRRERGGASLGL